MSEVKEQYHKADITHACCLRCHKPMSEWRAFDVCPSSPSGHILPSSPPTGFSDKGFLYRCDSCGYVAEGNEGLPPPMKCPQCITGMLSQEEWMEEHGKSLR